MQKTVRIVNIYAKGAIFITLRKSNKSQGLSPETLRQLICGAQCNVQQDIDALCHAFRPLIYKEGRRQTVYNALGEDAVSIAWVIFLKFIRRYNGCDYKNLPGLVRCHLRYELLHAVQKQGAMWDNEDLSTMEEGTEASGVPAKDDIGAFLLNNALAKSIASLTSKQRMVVQHMFYNNSSLTQTSRIMGCSHTGIQKHRDLALNNIKRYLA